MPGVPSFASGSCIGSDFHQTHMVNQPTSLPLHPAGVPVSFRCSSRAPPGSYSTLCRKGTRQCFEGTVLVVQVSDTSVRSREMPWEGNVIPKEKVCVSCVINRQSCRSETNHLITGHPACRERTCWNSCFVCCMVVRGADSGSTSGNPSMKAQLASAAL